MRPSYARSGSQSADCADVEKNQGRNGSAPETMSKRIARLVALSSRPSSLSINRVYAACTLTHKQSIRGSARTYGRETLLQPSVRSEEIGRRQTRLLRVLSTAANSYEFLRNKDYIVLQNLGYTFAI